MKVIEVSAADQKRLADARTLYWDDLVAKSPMVGAKLRSIPELYSR